MAINWDNVTAGSDLGGNAGSAAANLAVMLGAAGPGGRASAEEAVQVWRDLQTSNFNFRALKPAQLSVVAEYMPELWQDYVPQDVKTIADSPEMRSAQARGLQQLQSYTSGQTPTEDRVANYRIGNELGAEQKRAQDAVISSMARRGQVGVGDELSARLGAAGDVANAAGAYGAGVAADQAGRRFSAVGQAAGLAGQMRGQDIDTQSKNAAIVNAFNESIANIVNRGRQARAATTNDALQQNAATRQRVYGEQNPQLAAQAEQFNLVYPNELLGQQFSQQSAKAAGTSNALNKLAADQYDEQAARSQTLKSLGKSAGSLFGSGGGFLAGLF